MANLSKLKRIRMIEFLNKLRKEHGDDDDTVIAINEIELELTSKKYGLIWEEHEERVDEQIKTKVPVFTEVLDKEVIWDGDLPYNFLLEGDNLHSLRLLRKTHKESIDVIYIDPPYNTGNKDFVYNDEMISKEDNFRHSKWLSFMEKRIRIAWELLKPEGVILISIDDNELAALKMLCDEILDEKNYEAIITYVRKTSGKQDSSNFVKSTEYILVYSRAGLWNCNYLKAGEKITKRYNKIDKVTGKSYREVDLRKTGSNDRRQDRINLYYPFYYNSNTNDLFCKSAPLDTIPKGYIEFFPIKSDGTDGSWRWECKTAKDKIKLLTAHIMPKYKRINKWTVYEKDFIDKKEDVRTVKEHTFWDRKEFNSDNAVTDFTNFGFSNKDFSFPKSVELLKHIFELTTNENSLILDFFAGSGTAGQAVFELNKRDGGNRNIILCTNNEDNLCEKVTYQRLSKTIKGYEFKGKKEEVLYEKKLAVKDLENAEQILEDTQDIIEKYKLDYDKVTKKITEGVLKVVGTKIIIKKVEGIKANLKYYKTNYIEKISEDENYNVTEELLKHIVEMVQLEHAIKIDNNEYIIVLTDDDVDKIERDKWDLKNCKAVYISSQVLLTKRQETLFDDLGIESILIPKYYFDNELREAGEL
ncbi:MAG TPA: site-specific DNA-methyltransferase [Candidatus Paceibacterota bacterium]